MKPKQDDPKPVDFKFLRTLADTLEKMSPPYTDVQCIFISKIDDTNAFGKHQDYEMRIYGIRRGALKIKGGAGLKHLDDCTWEAAKIS